MDLRVASKTLEVMHRGGRVAIHAISTTEGEVCTLPEHRPVAHSRILEGEPRALMQWVQSVGASTAAMIRHHLEDRTDAANGLRAARRMRDFARLYGDQRFKEACAYALPLNITTLRSIESILKKSPDKQLKPATSFSTRAHHEHVRGANYYGES